MTSLAAAPSEAERLSSKGTSAARLIFYERLFFALDLPIHLGEGRQYVDYEEVDPAAFSAGLPAARVYADPSFQAPRDAEPHTAGVEEAPRDAEPHRAGSIERAVLVEL